MCSLQIRVHTIYHFQYKNKRKKIILNYPKSAAMEFFKGTQKRVRNSRDNRAISVQVLLYFICRGIIMFSNEFLTCIYVKVEVE